MLETEKKHQCTECKTTFIDTGIIERFEAIASDEENDYSYSSILKLIDFYLLHPLSVEKHAQDILRDKYHWRIKSKDKSGNQIWRLHTEKLFPTMLKISGLKDNISFTYTGKQTENVLQSMNLDKSHICSLHTRAVLNRDCKKEIVEDDDGKLSVKISSPEAGYRCLLRHIRNAFAHNNVLFFENGNVLLKDYQRDGDKQRDKKVTAAILIKFDTLFEWIRLIETDQERIEE